MTTPIEPEPAADDRRRLPTTVGRARRHRMLGPGVAALALAAGGLAACADDGEGEQQAAVTAPRSTELPRFGAALGVQAATYEYTIPDGAGAALAAGAKRANVLPGSLTATVGQSIRIENQDRQGHSVGPWYVGPNETLIQQFTAPGVFEGECTVHDSGRFILEVVEG